MPDSYSVYDAKSNFSMIVRDSAESGRVFLVGNAQRKSAQKAVVMGEAALRVILEHFVGHPEWEEDVENRLWTVYVPEIDEWGQGSSREEAAKDLVNGARELADLYLSQVAFNFQGGRTSEFPYMLRIALAADDSEVERSLGL